MATIAVQVRRPGAGRKNGKKDSGSDMAVWLGYRSLLCSELMSVDHHTTEALREIGDLDELVETSEGGEYIICILSCS